MRRQRQWFAFGTADGDSYAPAKRSRRTVAFHPLATSARTGPSERMGLYVRSKCSATYARDRLGNATKNLQSLLTIHYATGLLLDADFEQMPIYCIVVQDAKGKQSHFYGESEQDFLNQFSCFADDHPDHFWLHWGMGDERYGFDQIAGRHRFLGGDPYVISADKQIDLPNAFKIIYGRDFAGHPRLTTILKMNFEGEGGHGTDELLSGEQLIEASERGNVPLLRRDARRKVRGMFDLLILHDQGRLVTNLTRMEQNKKDGTTPVAESAAVKLFGPKNPPLIYGKPKSPLTKSRYDIVLLLIQAGSEGLTKDGLASKHGGAVNSLKTLAKSDDDWKKVIRLPGKTGQRYRIE